jgi:hypothetical protein
MPDEKPRPSESSRGLTRREFDDVIRRATELAASEADSGEGSLDEAELLRIAGEVGLPERHVRKALAEMRTGAIIREPTPTSSLDRTFGPEILRASRVVAGAPREIADKLDAFLVGGQLLQQVRRTDRMLQYRPAIDWASQVARAASATKGRYYVAASRWVEIRLEPLEEQRTLVEIEVDPGTRQEAASAAAAGIFFGGGGAGAGAAILAASVAPWTLALLAGLGMASGVGSLIWRATGERHKKKLKDVLAEIEGILDKLEMGDSLEPPPPAWRQWVKRHFHGVARDLFRDQ